MVEPVSAGELMNMRQNARNYWLAHGASRSSQRMQQSLANLDEQTSQAMQQIAANGSWPDVSYNAAVPDNFVPHYERMQTMARAWATEGTQWYRNDQLLSAILSAIDFIQGHVHTSTPLNRGNWWWWQIGIPERYAPTLLLLREELGSSRLTTTAATLNYLVGSTGPRYAAEGTGNQIWWAMGRIHYGMLADDAASVSTGAQRIAQQIRIVSGGEEGLMPDMSFQAHEEQLQTGHYGATFIFRTSEFTQIAEGTSYQLDAERFALLVRFLLEGASWTVYHRFFDISSEGRAFTRADRNAGAVLNALLIHANAADTPAQEEAAKRARHILQTWNFPLLTEYAGLAARLEAISAIAAMPSGTAVYNFSDYLIHRREQFFISLKTISDRTLIGETWNNENKRGRHLASGVTWIQTADEYRTQHVLPTLDYHRLPGITVENGLNLGVAYHYLPGRKSFVTAASAGSRAAAAMDFHARAHNNDSDLHARKSWFFFDGAMVALGSGITGPKARTVETIINQRPMATVHSDILVNGNLHSTTQGIVALSDVSWIHEGEVGYIFPAPSTVTVRRANQSGKWSDIGSGDSSSTHINPMLTLWFNHGQMPVNQSYAYIVLPAASATLTAQVAAASPFEILAQNNALHAVRHQGEQAVGAVFWQAGEVAQVTVDQPCVVFWHIAGNELNLTLSVPDGSHLPVHLTWPSALTPLQVPTNVTSVVKQGSTQIQFNPVTGGNPNP